MNPGYVIHKPGGWRVASLAIEPCGALVNIDMTLIAFALSHGENQGRMTLSATDRIMLPVKNKFCFIMIKRVNRFIYLPAFGSVTGITADFEIIPVG
jgi:hypothetical protein